MTKYFDFDNKENYGIQVCTSTTRPTAYDGRPIYETDTNKFLIYNGSAWIEISSGSGITDHGALTGLADDDHTQYLLVNGTRSMAATLDMNNNNVANVGTLDLNNIAANTDPDITTHDSIVPSGDSLYDLGDSTHYFALGYFDQLHFLAGTYIKDVSGDMELHVATGKKVKIVVG